MLMSAQDSCCFFPFSFLFQLISLNSRTCKITGLMSPRAGSKFKEKTAGFGEVSLWFKLLHFPFEGIEHRHLSRFLY